MGSCTKTCIFTIGHSNHPWDKFAALLQTADIRALVDVRSYPRSRFAHFNQAPLMARLAELDIDYLHLGNELGGRSEAGNTFDYEVIATSPRFSEALTRAAEIAGKQRTVLMCSEHEPLTCHRCLLLGRSLAERGIAVRHILRDGCIEPHAQTEDRLLAITGKKTADLLAAPAERIALAYSVQVQALRRKAK